MAFNDLVASAQTYFPTLQVKYKDQSALMKILGKIMFFNPGFMTSYLTTLGTTVYIPNEQYVQDHPQITCDVFIHECTHMYDAKRIGFIYQLVYAFPQLLSPLMLLLLFVLSWKIVLPLVLLFLLPLPAPWRVYFERRAYFVQMYVGNKMYGNDPAIDGSTYASWFRDGSYYWMWIFQQNQSFTQEAANVLAGKPACVSEPALLQQIDTLMAAALK